MIHQSGADLDYALREGYWKLIMRAKDVGKKKGKSKDVIGLGVDDIEPIALFNLKDNLNEKKSEFAK